MRRSDDLGNLVASNMAAILESDEHRSLFRKVASSCSCDCKGCKDGDCKCGSDCPDKCDCSMTKDAADIVPCKCGCEKCKEMKTHMTNESGCCKYKKAGLELECGCTCEKCKEMGSHIPGDSGCDKPKRKPTGGKIAAEKCKCNEDCKCQPCKGDCPCMKKDAAKKCECPSDCEDCTKDEKCKCKCVKKAALKCKCDDDCKCKPCKGDCPCAKKEAVHALLDSCLKISEDLDDYGLEKTASGMVRLAEILMAEAAGSEELEELVRENPDANVTEVTFTEGDARPDAPPEALQGLELGGLEGEEGLFEDEGDDVEGLAAELEGLEGAGLGGAGEGELSEEDKEKLRELGLDAEGLGLGIGGEPGIEAELGLGGDLGEIAAATAEVDEWLRSTAQMIAVTCS